IQHDIANPELPKTAIGILVAALRFCYQQNQAPFTVLSCDNMPHNGASTRAAVMQLAAQTDARFAEWIGEQVRFPSTMVDRIVPAVTDNTIVEVNDLLVRAKAPWGCDDRAPIACEGFSQWVIEDNFAKGRPDFAEAGAEMVSDVAPWEEMKLRMLNGSHSIIAYLGCLAGYDTVAECMNNTALVALIRRYMLEEAAPTLAMPATVNIEDYANALLARFSNVSLQHKTRQIAMDGSQKIPQRWLQGVAIRRRQGALAAVTALGFAAWIVYLQRSVQAPGYSVDDPLAATIVPLACSANDSAGVIAFLQQPVLTQFELSEYRPWVDALVQAIALLQRDVKATIAAQTFNESAHE
ncbi:MAG TPA: mannitol dehydrogenase family protein, partial [Marinagarivorans sp.]